MNHHPDTPAFVSMPGHTRLYRRHNGVYYLRAKVPEKLRPIVGKTEIRKSLGTTNYNSALSKVKGESIGVDVLFRNAWEKAEPKPPAPAKLSREEILWLVSDWFIKEEERADEWGELGLPKLTENQRETVKDNLISDSSVLGNHPAFACYDGDALAAAELESLLTCSEGKRWGVERNSEDFAKLLRLFKRAKLESLSRAVDRVEGRKVETNDPHFANLHAGTQLTPPPRPTMLLGKFLDDFMDYQQRAHAKTTPGAYVMPVRALREVIGERAHLHTITRQQVEKVCVALKNAPKNMAQLFPPPFV